MAIRTTHPSPLRLRSNHLSPRMSERSGSAPSSVELADWTEAFHVPDKHSLPTISPPSDTMPAPQTCDIFIDLCRKSGVVEDERLDSFLNQHPLPADPRLVAAYMVQAGLLTRFQAVQLLHGKYRGFVLNGLKILEQIGAGGMGTVYLCEQVKLRRKVAVKVLPSKQAEDRVARERFLREARAVAALDHPNIIRIHDCASSDDIHYLLMEYVDGIDLQVKIDRNGRLGVDEAIGYILQATAGLLHAHERGLVHRDVKPSNLLLDAHGTIKLLDMGLARFFQDAADNLTQQHDGGAVVGTVDFLAPEQAIESSNVDARADIYSLGATLYTLLSGKPPFGGTTTQKLINHQVKTPPPLNEIRRDVPVELNAIVQKMMAKNPDERYQSAQEVMEILAAWAPAPTIRSSTTTTTIQSPRASVLPPALSDVSPKPPKSASAVVALPEKKPIRKELLIGGGIACAAVLGVVVILSLGGGKDYAEPIPIGTDIKVKEQLHANLGTPKPDATPRKVEPKKPLPSVVKKAPPAPPIPKEGRVLAALDWKDFEPLVVRYRRYDRLESRGDGKFPRDWKTAGWDMDSVVETALERVDGEPAVVQRNIEGKPCNMVFTPPLRFSPAARYEVHVEYRTRGEGRGKLVLQDDLLKQRTVGEFLPSKDEWRTQRFCFDGFPSDVPGRFEFHLMTIGPEASIAYRRIQVRELPLPARDPEVPVYKIDFSEVPPFSVRYLQMNPLPSASVGSLPEGWSANCWKAGSQCETTIEEFGSTPLLALRNLDGDPTLQFRSALPMQGLRAGKMYRLRVTYMAEWRCNAEFQIRMQVPDTSNTYFPGVAVQYTHGLLRTLEQDFSPLPNQNYDFCAQNLSKGEQSTLFLKSVEVLEAPPPVGESVAKLDASALQPFKSTLREREELYRDGAGNLPAGWEALTGRPRAIGTVGVEKIADRNALSLEVLEGDPSIRIQSSKPLGTLLAGHTYELRARYSSPANRRAAVSVCDGAYGPLMKLALLPTDAEWRTSSLRLDIRNDQPFNLVVTNTGKPEEGKVYFESVELVDVTK
jgi:serine/threonine protein kinase